MLRVFMLIDIITDFAINKDKRFQEMLIEFNEFGSPLMENLYLGNTMLSMALMAFFSIEIIRVIFNEKFRSLLTLSLISIQVDLVWHFLDVGLELWPLSIIGLFLSFAFNFLALAFAHMIYLKQAKLKEMNFQKITI